MRWLHAVTELTITLKSIGVQKVSNAALTVKWANLIDTDVVTTTIVSAALIDICELKDTASQHNVK